MCICCLCLCSVKEKLQALLNVDRQFSEDDFEKVLISFFVLSLYTNMSVRLRNINEMAALDQ